MNIPRFSAEASLYKTSLRYGYSLGAFAQTNTGVIPQQVYYGGPPFFSVCGQCYLIGVGVCAKLCRSCVIDLFSLGVQCGNQYPVSCDPRSCFGGGGTFGPGNDGNNGVQLPQ
jgi:hypothetical protein